MRDIPFSHINLRCPLFIPGNRDDMLAKADRYSPSAFIPDLEDSVPTAYKEAARTIVADALPQLAAIGRPIVPRVNSLETGLTRLDLEAVVTPEIAAVSIGKVNHADDIAEVDDIVSQLERSRGIEMGAVGILPWIETAKAVVNAYTLCRASRRVRWVAFGAEDYSADMGIPRFVDVETADSGRVDEYGEASLLYARSAVAVAVRAANVQALDTPFVMFRNAAGLVAETNLARRLGYAGKFAIHPAQIEPIMRVFSPTESEIARAKRVIEAAELAEREGHGSVNLEGEMIDAPVVARCRNILRELQTD